MTAAIVWLVYSVLPGAYMYVNVQGLLSVSSRAFNLVNCGFRRKYIIYIQCGEFTQSYSRAFDHSENWGLSGKF